MSTCLRCGGEVSSSDIQCAKCGEALRKQTHELVGKSLADKYLIEEHLGSGGMCDVYRATHSGMGKQVFMSENTKTGRPDGQDHDSRGRDRQERGGHRHDHPPLAADADGVSVRRLTA